MKNKEYKITLLISFILLLIISFSSLFFGQQRISFYNIIKVIANTSLERMDYIIIYKIRLPRILASILVGSALSLSGAILQGIFSNPLASPYLLGISNGAGFGASLAIILGTGSLLIQIFSFFFGILASLLALLFSYLFKSKGTISIIIGGILIANFFSALTMYLKMVADPLAKLPSIVYWLMGSFSNVTMQSLYIPFVFILISTIILLMLSWKLNILAFGDIHAKTLGENPSLLKAIALILTTIATSSAISISGIIGWIGIIIPQLIKIRTGQDFKKLLPLSIIWGAAYCCAMDSIARIFIGYELPVGIISSLFGIPFTAFILSKKNY